MRPSLGVTDLEGVIPWSPYVCNHLLDVHALTRIRLFDSLGVFSRDLDTYVSAAKILHAGPNSQRCSSVRTFLCLTLQPNNKTRSRRRFCTLSISGHLSMQKVKRSLMISSASSSHSWESKGRRSISPKCGKSPILSTPSFRLKSTFTTHYLTSMLWTNSVFMRISLESTRKPLERCPTSTPKVNSDCKFIIESLKDLDAKSNSEWAPTMTEDMREKGVNQLAVFKKWFESDILPVDGDDCSENLLLLPWTFGQPDYRDLYRE